MKFYILKNKEMPWGDYGELLWQGIYFYDKKQDKHYLSRSGPFCPPIFRTQYDNSSPVIILTQEALRIVEAWGVPGIKILPITKDKIVKLKWETWDKNAKEPAVYPSGDMDAEEYITRRRHNQKLSEEMGDFFAILPSKNGLCFFDSVENTSRLVAETAENIPFFVADSLKPAEIYLSEDMKTYLEKDFGQHLRLHPSDCCQLEPDELISLKKDALRRADLKAKAEKMTAKDWREWNKSLTKAKNLITTYEALKSEEAKSKRAISICSILEKANALYPINYEKWMLTYWERK